MLGACTAEGGPAPNTPTPTTPPPSELSGAPVPDAGFRLILATSPVSLFDPATGVSTPLPGAPAGDRVNDVLRVGDIPVVLSAARCGASCLEPSEVFVYGDPETFPRSLGKARSAAPSADANGVWLIRDDGNDLCRLQYVSLMGAERDRGRPASCATVVRREIEKGLLISVNTGNSSTAEDVLIDPRTGRAVHQFPRIMAVTPDRMLIAELTKFSVLDLRNGQRTELDRPVANGSPGPAVPSRDGHKIGVVFGDPAWRGTSTHTADVWVLDLDTLTWRQTPSMPFSTFLKRATIDWSGSDDLVLVADMVVAGWHWGEPQWRIVKTSPPEERNSSAVAVG